MSSLSIRLKGKGDGKNWRDKSDGGGAGERRARHKVIKESLLPLHPNIQPIKIISSFWDWHVSCLGLCPPLPSPLAWYSDYMSYFGTSTAKFYEWKIRNQCRSPKLPRHDRFSIVLIAMWKVIISADQCWNQDILILPGNIAVYNLENEW